MSSTASAQSFENAIDEAPILKSVEPLSDESVAVHEVRRAISDPIFRFVMSGFVTLFTILVIAAYLSF